MSNISLDFQQMFLRIQCSFYEIPYGAIKQNGWLGEGGSGGNSSDRISIQTA